MRPLREMTCRAVFNEVFLTDAVVPAQNLVGELHDGWRVTLTTLANERRGLGANASGGGGKLDIPDQDLTVRLRDLMDAAASHGRGLRPPTPWLKMLLEIARQRGVTSDPVVRQELMRNYIAGEVARISGLRVAAAAEEPPAAAAVAAGRPRPLCPCRSWPPR